MLNNVNFKAVSIALALQRTYVACSPTLSAKNRCIKEQELVRSKHLAENFCVVDLFQGGQYLMHRM